MIDVVTSMNRIGMYMFHPFNGCASPEKIFTVSRNNIL